MSVATPYNDSKGVRRDQWSARTLAMTADHMAFVDLQCGGATFGVADVVTTSTNFGVLAIALSNGAEYRFATAPEALEHVETDLRQLVAWHRGSRGGL